MRQSFNRRLPEHHAVLMLNRHIPKLIGRSHATSGQEDQPLPADKDYGQVLRPGLRLELQRRSPCGSNGDPRNYLVLVLTRHCDQSIMIGDDIEVTIVDMKGGKVRLGINAPKHISVHRKEVYEAIRRENENGDQTTDGNGQTRKSA